MKFIVSSLEHSKIKANIIVILGNGSAKNELIGIRANIKSLVSGDGCCKINLVFISAI
jgi:hypothetical protein